MTSLERQIRANAAVGRTLGVIMADIDHFKEINDSYGHGAGDAALREFTRRLSAILRQSDYLGRYGSEEFLLLVGDTNREQVMHAAERFRLAIAETPFDIGAASRPITASFGIALTSGVASPRRPLLRRPIRLSVPPRPAAETGACLPDPLRRCDALMTTIGSDSTRSHLTSWYWRQMALTTRTLGTTGR